MYNNDTQPLFPLRVAPALRTLRGEEWHLLVEQVLSQPIDSPDSLAFVLLMARLGNCTTCQADSLRAMRGCTECARQVIRRYRGTDTALVNLHAAARGEVLEFLKKNCNACPSKG